MLNNENEIGRPAQAGIEEPFSAGPIEEGIRPFGEQGRQAVGNGSDAKDIGTEAHLGLAYQWERFGTFAKELPPLFKRHWKEIALNQDKVPLDPDWDRYFAYDLAGILHCLTVRSNNALVGYLFVFVFPHLHYASSLWAMTDIFWLDPVYRRGMAGMRMFKEMEAHLKQCGVKVVSANTKLHFEADRGTISKLFKRLGYKPVEMVHSKFIG